jgi:hypothetical protein
VSLSEYGFRDRQRPQHNIQLSIQAVIHRLPSLHGRTANQRTFYSHHSALGCGGMGAWMLRALGHLSMDSLARAYNLVTAARDIVCRTLIRKLPF